MARPHRHLHNSGDAGSFVILSEEAISKGVRRIVAVTGPAADSAIERAGEIEEQIHDGLTMEQVISLTKKINAASLPSFDKAKLRDRGEPPALVCAGWPLGASPLATPSPPLACLCSVTAIKKKLDAADKARKAALAKNAVARAKSIVEEGVPKVLVEVIDCGANAKALGEAARTVRASAPDSLVMFFGQDAGAVCCLCQVPKGASLPAKDWLKPVSECLGAKGGGSKEQAQCAGQDPSRVEEALRVALEFAKLKVE